MRTVLYALCLSAANATQALAQARTTRELDPTTSIVSIVVIGCLLFAYFFLIRPFQDRSLSPPKSDDDTPGWIDVDLNQQIKVPEPANAVDEALRGFATFMQADKQPPAWQPLQGPNEPAATFNPTLPTASPQVHMKTALSYLGEADEFIVKQKAGLTFDQSVELLSKIELAAQHAAKARDADPEATITIPEKDGETIWTIDALSYRLLIRAGVLAMSAAQTIGGSEREGWRYLRHAEDSFVRALKYRATPDAHMLLAETYKALGNKDAGMNHARAALALDPAYTDAIKFVDHSGGEWRPMWRDIPEPETFDLLKFWKLALWAGVALGLFLMWFSSSFTAPTAPIMIVIGLICLGFSVYGLWINWKDSRAAAWTVEATYQKSLMDAANRSEKRAYGYLNMKRAEDEENARRGR